MTRIAVMQPYFLPALGYLQLAQAVDAFVFYDDAHFSSGRWTHRNRIRVNEAPHLFTVPLARRGPSQTLAGTLFDPRGYDRWRGKFLKTVRQAYARAPFLDRVLPELEAVLAGGHASLAELSAASVRWLAEAFGIDAHWAYASALDYDRSAEAQNKVLAMVEAMRGQDYVNMPGGRRLYDPHAFAAHGVRLGFMENRAGDGDGFDLSALHLMMHRAPEELATLASACAVDWSA